WRAHGAPAVAAHAADANAWAATGPQPAHGIHGRGRPQDGAFHLVAVICIASHVSGAGRLRACYELAGPASVWAAGHAAPHRTIPEFLEQLAVHAATTGPHGRSYDDAAP